MNLYIIFVLISFYVNSVWSLEAITSPTKLPYGTFRLKALYDKDDSILLLGGSKEQIPTLLDTVLRFTLATEEIEVVGRFPYGIRAGSTEFIDPNVLYFGGSTSFLQASYYIWSTNGSNLNPSPIGEVPVGMYSICSAYNGNDSVFITGGLKTDNYQYDIIKYNVLDGISQNVATLPNPAVSCSAIWFNNSMYIFGGGCNDRNVLRYTPSAGNKLEILPVSIPAYFFGGSVVTNGKLIYLVDGFTTETTDGIQMKIATFDPVAETFTYDTVTNLPGSRYASAVYVTKSNRIYIFGGALQDDHTISDQIHFINLQ